jgi:hypothetical protein
VERSDDEAATRSERKARSSVPPVNVSSIVGHRSLPTGAAYSTKAAQISLTEIAAHRAARQWRSRLHRASGGDADGVRRGGRARVGRGRGGGCRPPAVSARGGGGHRAVCAAAAPGGLPLPGLARDRLAQAVAAAAPALRGGRLRGHGVGQRRPGGDAPRGPRLLLPRRDRSAQARGELAGSGAWDPSTDLALPRG